MEDPGYDPRMREILPGIFTWSVMSEPHGCDFNGTLVVHADGNLCIDPVEPVPRTARRSWIAWWKRTTPPLPGQITPRASLKPSSRFSALPSPLSRRLRIPA